MKNALLYFLWDREGGGISELEGLLHQSRTMLIFSRENIQPAYLCPFCKRIIIITMYHNVYWKNIIKLYLKFMCHFSMQERGKKKISDLNTKNKKRLYTYIVIIISARALHLRK